MAKKPGDGKKKKRIWARLSRKKDKEIIAREQQDALEEQKEETS